MSYRNIVETIIYHIKNKTSKTAIKHLQCFNLYVDEWGSRRIEIGKMYHYDSAIAFSKTFWPVFIQNINKKDTILIEPIKEIFKSEFIGSIKHLCIPIFVKTTANINKKHHTNNEFLFWFSPNKEFYDALPNDVAEKWKDYFTNDKINNYKETLSQYQHRIENSYKTPLNKLLTENDLNEINTSTIVLTKKGEKEIGLNTSSNGFVLQGKIYDDNYAKKIKLKIKNNTSEIRISNINNQTKNKEPEINIVGVTDTKLINFISFYKPLDNEVNTSQRLEHKKRFIKEYKSLIPIKANENYIIWFKASNNISEIINMHQKLENINFIKSNIIQLNNENELRNINISFTPDGIKVPSYIQNKTKIFGIYNNNETNIHFEGLSFKNKLIDDISNLKTDSSNNNTSSTNTTGIIPVLITTGNGIGWKSYSIDPEKFMTEKDILEMKNRQISPLDFEPYKIANKKAKEELNNKLNTLLPILIRHPTLSNTSIIAWYSIDSNLIAALPPTLSKKIININTKNEHSISCEFIESCKINNKHFDAMIYPNPFENELNIAFKVATEQSLKLVITDINGKQIKELESGSHFYKGEHTLNFKSLSELSGGIYLFQIKSENNIIFVKRIIKGK